MAERVETIRLTAVVSNYLSGMAQAEAATLKMATSAQLLAKQGAAMTTLGRDLLLFGGVVAAGVVVAVKAFADFDAKMAQVKTLSYATGGEMTKLAAAAETLGQKIGISANQAADAELELVKAGISVSDILGGALQGALQLAAAGQIDVAQATEIATIALTQFKLKGADVPHVADLLAAGADKALGGVNDLGEALKSGGLVASQFGISLDDTVGVLSAFANAGLLGETAGTDLRQMLLKLANPSAQSAAEMQKLGINIYDTSGKFVGLTDLAGQLHDKLGDATQATRNQALAVIFGSRAIAGGNVLYAEGAKGIADWISKVNVAGFAARQAAGKMDNLNGDISKLGAAFQKDLIDTGSQANVVLRDAVQALTGLITALGNVPSPVLGTGLAVGSLVAVLALASGAFLTIVPRIAATKAALIELVPAGSAASASMSKLSGVLAGPWGIAITAGLLILDAWSNAQVKAGQGVDDLTASLNQQTGALTDASRAKIVQQLQDQGTYDAAKKAGISIREVNAAVFDGGKALEIYNKKTADYYATVGVGGNIVRSFSGEESALADGVNVARQNIDSAKDAHKNLAAAQTDGTKTTQSAADAYQSEATKAQNLVDQISSLIDEFNKANGIGQDAVSQNAAYQKALADTSQSVKDYVAAHGRSTAALDESTVAGSANAAMLADLAQKNEGAAKAQFDLDGNTTNYLATLTAGHQAVVDNAIALGATADEAQAIADKVAGIPSQAQIDILVNTQQATQTIDALMSKFNTLNAAAAAAGARYAGLAAKYANMPGHGYASGGYTPPRASLVTVGEKGTEFVSTAATVANPSNRAALEYMHAGGVIRGYADGGYTSPQYVVASAASRQGSDPRLVQVLSELASRIIPAAPGGSAAPVDLTDRTISALAKANVQQTRVSSRMGIA